MPIFKSYLGQDYEKIKQQLLNSGKLFEGFYSFINTNIL